MDPQLDWNLVRSFVAVCETGSLAGAARSLGLAHPTVARHVQQLEGQLGVALFDRRPRGLHLNDAGVRLAGAGERMVEGARRFEAACRTVRDQDIGLVRLAVPETLADLSTRLLGPLRRAGHAVAVDLIRAEHHADLLERDADIAVRHTEPAQPELIRRRLTPLPFGLFASEEYLATRGQPEVSRLSEHWFIDGIRQPWLARKAQALGCPISRSQFVFRSDSLAGQVTGALAGWGVAALPVHIARGYPGLQRILHDAPIRAVETWLVGRPEVRTNRHLKETFRMAGETLDGLIRDDRVPAVAPAGANLPA